MKKHGASALSYQAQIDALSEAYAQSEGSARTRDAALAIAEVIARAESQREMLAAQMAALYPDMVEECEDEECVMGVWQNTLDVDDSTPQVPVAAGTLYEYAPEGAAVSNPTTGERHPGHKDTSYVVGSQRVLANDKELANIVAWEREEFLDYRRPLGSAFQPGYDWQHGYRLDPRWVANESAMEREYGPMHIIEVESHVVDPWTGNLIANEDGTLKVETENVPRAGSVTWEYERRNKEVPFRDGTDKRAGLPWIGTKMRSKDTVRTADGYVGTAEYRYSTPWTECVAVNIGGINYHYATRNVTVLKEGRYGPTPHARKHFAWIMAQERSYMVRAARKAQQRENIIALARKIGGDPRSPKFVAWVKQVGYDTAQAKLITAYAAKKQTVASA